MAEGSDDEKTPAIWIDPAQPLEPLHEDPAFVVLDKPTGLLSVPGRGPDKADCLFARVRRRWPDARVIHRLDRDTSGAIVFARTAEVQRRLARQFERRRVGKRYIALIAGEPDGGAGMIDLPLRKDMQRKFLHVVDPVQGKAARTRWRVLGGEPGRRRLELRPETGRSHQLRVHCAAMGWPIVGDPLYGGGQRPDAERLMLHATELAFEHPETGAIMRFTSDPPF